MPLSPGTRLGAYEILAPLGAGGMGEVYRGRDTRLGREVALKLLPEKLAGDLEYMARFEREAQVLASLNHPNIAAIYGLEQSAIVMELVEGETLKGPVPIAQAIAIARQLVDALEYAHEKGVIHRDLKPANIKITPEGAVKVLDFGLAKLSQPETPGPDQPTLTLTIKGAIMGTPSYMAPEQARAQEVDKRADIWAFGAVLYEMLSGRIAFPGENVTDILASVVKLEPEWGAVPPETPPAVLKLIKRCLLKDRKQRLRDIGEARIAIEEHLADPGKKVDAPRSRMLPWAVTGVVTAALAAIAFLHFRELPPPLPLLKVSLLPPEKTSFFSPVISPDGRRVAFIGTPAGGKSQIWVRALDSLSAQVLPGTEDVFAALAWSSDSRFLAFTANGKLKKIEVTGGPPQTIGEGNFTALSWSQAAVILGSMASGNGRGVSRIPVAGGTATQITTPGKEDRYHRLSTFLPDGTHFLFSSVGNTREQTALWVGSLDATAPVRLANIESNVAFVPTRPGASDGFLLFARETTLLAQPFDAARLRTVGESFPVAEGVGFLLRGPFQFSFFSVSDNGMLAYSGGGQSRSQLAWYSREGRQIEAVGPPRVYWDMSLAPDGKRVAVNLPELQGGYELWVMDLARDAISRISFERAASWNPVWSPDGGQIVRGNTVRLQQKASDGTGKDEMLFMAEGFIRPTAWSRDGQSLVCAIQSPKTKNDLWVFSDMKNGAPGRKPTPFLATPYDETQGKLSPDGKWLAYTSDETGSYQVYVQPFPAGRASGKWQLSAQGGAMPQWRGDGKELFFLAPDRKLMAVEVTGAAAFQAGVPKPLFATRVATNNVLDYYAPSADGKRFLLMEPVEETALQPITMLVNWMGAVKK